MKKYMHFIHVAVFSTIISSNLSGQQLPNSSHFTESFAFWNPANTATGEHMIADGLIRRQWVGFNGAPATGIFSFQMPFLDSQMSGGAMLYFDQTGPVSKTGAKLNYSYKLKNFVKKYGQLSLGLSGSVQQYSFNASGEVFNDVNDIRLNNANVSSFFPAVGVGAFYLSSTRMYKENVYYIGVAANQLLASDVLIADADQTRTNHVFFSAGAKFFNFNMMIEPTLSANLVSPDLLDALFSLKMEMKNSFWAGLGYSNTGLAAVQGGFILDKFGSRDGQLRVGLLSSYGLTGNASVFGPSVELYTAYHISR